MQKNINIWFETLGNYKMHATFEIIINDIYDIYICLIFELLRNVNSKMENFFISKNFSITFQ